HQLPLCCICKINGDKHMGHALSKFIFFITALLAIFQDIAITSVCYAAEDTIATNLISKVKESERQIRSIEAHVITRIPDEDIVFFDVNWGYENGKEYSEGKLAIKNPNDLTKLGVSEIK